jgi:hypothetical protein
MFGPAANPENQCFFGLNKSFNNGFVAGSIIQPSMDLTVNPGKELLM